MSYEKVEYTDPLKYNATNEKNLTQLYSQLGEENGPKLTSILKEYKDQGKWRGFINEVLGSRDKSRLLNETLATIYSGKVNTGNSRNAAAAAAQQNMLRRSGALKPSPANPRQTQSAISGASGLGVANSMNAKGPFRKPTAAEAAATIAAAAGDAGAGTGPTSRAAGTQTGPGASDSRRLNALESGVRSGLAAAATEIRGTANELRGRANSANAAAAAAQAQAESARREVGALRGQATAAQREIERLSGEITALSAAQRAAAERAAAAAATPPAATALQGAAQEAGQTTVIIRETGEQSQETIRQLIASHEATIRELTAQQADLVAEIQGATNANRTIAANAARSSDAAAARTADAIRESGAQTTQQIELVVAGFREALGPINATLSGLPAMIASIQASGGTNDEQIAELIRQNGDLRESTGNLRGRIESLEREIGTTTERLSRELQDQQTGLKGEIDQLKAQLAAKGTGTGTSNTPQILEALKEVMKTHTEGLKDIVAALKPAPITVTTTTPAGMNTKAELIELGAAQQKLKELESLKARLTALEKAKANAPTSAAKNALAVKINTVTTDLTAATGTDAGAGVTGATGAAGAAGATAATKKNTNERCKFGWRNIVCGPGKPCKHRIKCGPQTGGRRRTRHKNKRTHKTHKTYRRGRR
jgi:chromosome segregation ATPase